MFFLIEVLSQQTMSPLFAYICQGPEVASFGSYRPKAGSISNCCLADGLLLSLLDRPCFQIISRRKRPRHRRKAVISLMCGHTLLNSVTQLFS